MTTSPIPLADVGLPCPDCGLMPVLRHQPRQAVAAVRSLVTRFGVLFRHADPAALVRRDDGPESGSALDHASCVTYDLAVLDGHLRTFLGEEHRAPACPEPAAVDVGQDAVLDALTRTAEQLACVIVGATDADWQRTSITSNRWVVDLMVLTFHDAGHELHAAERAVHAVSDDSEWRGQCGARMVAARGPAAIVPLRMR